MRERNDLRLTPGVLFLVVKAGRSRDRRIEHTEHDCQMRGWGGVRSYAASGWCCRGCRKLGLWAVFTAAFSIAILSIFTLFSPAFPLYLPSLYCLFSVSQIFRIYGIHMIRSQLNAKVSSRLRIGTIASSHVISS